MLNEIVAKQKDYVSSLAPIPSKEIQQSTRSLAKALNNSPRGFIFECKKSSPSKGDMIDQYNPVERALSYEPFACAISVLTNPIFFGGSLDCLTKVAHAVSVPVICKDIIVNSSQVERARIAGADAILLMLSVLDDAMYLECTHIAKQLNMDIITEIHNQAELERALQFQATIIGINHRNFDDMSVSFRPTFNLAHKIPKDIIVISESGIQNFTDVQALCPYTKNFLIGSALSQSEQPDIKVREIVFGFIKICGLTTMEDARLSYDLGASMGGLNFVPSSPRTLTLAQAQKLTVVPLQWVGVFQNQSIEDITRIASSVQLAAVQLHGDETVEMIRALKSNLRSGVKIIKAITCQQLDLLDSPDIDVFILDSTHNNQFGGTGLAVTLNQAITKHADKIILAGGIGPSNIATKLKHRFKGFDINSRVETAPGIKDANLLKQFFQKIDSYRSSV